MLQELSHEIEDVLVGVEGAVDVQTEQFSGQNNLVIRLDRDALARLGMDVDAVQEDLKSRGVAFEGPPIDRPYGRIASFQDPDGYMFDLCG